MSGEITIKNQFTAQDAWRPLRRYTNARIAVGRAGNAIPLAENLQFRADHAHARDAVYANLDVGEMVTGLNVLHQPIIQLYTQAKDRSEYLQRPDKGRRLHPESQKKIIEKNNFDLAFIIADGLSAKAVQISTQPVLHILLNLSKEAGFTVAPLCIVQQARVAVADEIGSRLNALLSVIFIGERPGLSSPHSMGIYITYKPVAGLTDESRYCISNIHTPGGLSPADAALQAFALIQQSFRLKLSGVHAKSQRELG